MGFQGRPVQRASLFRETFQARGGWEVAPQLAIYAPRCIDTPLPRNQNTRLVFAEGYPSGQREQTVNLPAYAFEGSNPSPSTIGGGIRPERAPAEAGWLSSGATCTA